MLNNESKMIFSTETLNDKVYNVLKERILTGDLVPGSRLVDSTIAKEYGISRTPVRDAIRMLVDDGLVISNATRGYSVFKATKRDIAEIFELRALLERAMLVKLINTIMPLAFDSYCERIDRIEQELRSNIESGELPFLVYDEKYHHSLMELMGNSRILSVYSENLAQTRGCRYKTTYSCSNMEKLNELHFALLEAIKKMDLDEALEVHDQHRIINDKNTCA